MAPVLKNLPSRSAVSAVTGLSSRAMRSIRVRGHRLAALGVEHFGQTGSIDDLYRHHDIDANAIIDAAEGLTSGAPVRHRKMAV